MPKLLPQPGRAYVFWYPRYNYLGLPKKMEFRKVLVTSVRDTQRDKLDPETPTLNPTLKRGRWLVTGEDLDKRQERSFYYESMQEIQQFDPNTQPLESAAYAIVDQDHVAYRASTITEAAAFLIGARRGVLCRVIR